MKLHIRKVRNRQNMSQANLAAKAGIFPSALSRIECGVVDPRLSTLVRIAAALRVPPAKLFG